MDPLNVFSDHRELLEAVAVGGGGRNEMKDPSPLEPSSFGYNFAHLPDVAFENCLDMLGVSEQMFLTIFENSVRERIERLDKKDVIINVVLGSNMACVQLITKKGKGEVYLVKDSDYSRGPYGAVYGNGEREENKRSFSICREKFEQKKELVRNVFHCHQVCNDVKFFVEHLETVFHGKLHTVRIDAQYGETCSRINPKLLHCKKVIIPDSVSNETFNEMEAEFEVQNMVSRGPHMAGFRPTQVIRKDTYDSAGYSIQMKDLDLLQCRVISFCKSRFEAKHYNKIIRNWMSGSYEKVEMMIFWVCDWDIGVRTRVRTDPVATIDGIDHSEVGEVKMPTIMENAANSVKVQGSDGRFAVVTTEGRQNGRMFHFRLIVLNDDGHEPECSIEDENIPSFDWPRKVRKPQV